VSGEGIVEVQPEMARSSAAASTVRMREPYAPSSRVNRDFEARCRSSMSGAYSGE